MERPFDADFLQDVVLAELKGVGWIKDQPSAELVEHIRAEVEHFLSQSVFNDPRINLLEDRLIRTCLARENAFTHRRQISRATLTPLGIDLPPNVTVGKSLMPLVYIQIIQACGYDVESCLRHAFQSWHQQSKGSFFAAVEAEILHSGIFESRPENLLKTLKALISCNSDGKVRLGERLFDNDEETLSLWKKHFSN